MTPEPRTFEIAIDGLPSAVMWPAGSEDHATHVIAVDADPDKVREIKVFVAQPAADVVAGITRFTFTVRDLAGSETGSTATDFYAPGG